MPDQSSHSQQTSNNLAPDNQQDYSPSDIQFSLDGSLLSEHEAYLQLSINPDERLRLIEENVRDFAIFVVAPDGRIASWNVGAERIIGYTEAEAIGMDCARIFVPEDIARGAVEHERVTARDTGRCEDERWHLRKDGTRFWGSGIMTGLRDQKEQFRGFVKILRDMSERKVAEMQRQEQAQRLAEQKRQAAILDERNRIAREIHDTIAQGLTGIAIHIEAAEDALRMSPEQAVPHITRIKQLARESLSEARRSLRALRPKALDDNDLPTALNNLARQTMQGADLQVDFAIQGTAYSLLPEDENDLLRIAQEALTNILKHAQATHADLILSFLPMQVQLSVTDNGRGFDIEQNITSGFGLIGMKERTQRMGAELQIYSVPGVGTQILVTLPNSNVTGVTHTADISETPIISTDDSSAETPDVISERNGEQL